MAPAVKSSAASVALAAVLAASLAGKVVANHPVVKVDRAAFERRAADFLEGHGYAVEVGRTPINPLIYGRKGECRLMIGDYGPNGTFANVFERAARSVGQLHFYYRGEQYRTAPKVRPLTEYYIQREFRQIGRAVNRTLLVAVAASPDCDLGTLDWSQLTTLPR